jgi:glycine dehydrogenase subunit 1
MNRYIPHTQRERDEMLRVIGVKHIDDLFADVPENLRMRQTMNLPAMMSELELSRHLSELAARNPGAHDRVCFAGGGVYDHYVPSIVNHLALRSEFYTAYTPYQAEVSQGTLQAIFEYQTMICELTGMDVSNASVYDAASACAEAMIMAFHQTGRDGMLMLGGINPEYADTCGTYARFRNYNIADVHMAPGTGHACLKHLEQSAGDNTAAVFVQSPNFYGVVEDIEAIARVAHDKGALLVVISDPIALGLLEKPGALGADIVVGEGQSLGNTMNYGGPGLGFFACKQAFARKMPGRIIGETTDKDGSRGWVLTMQAREQHIRREKATSNICSNQALCALCATIYMSTMGKRGLRDAARLSLQKAHYMLDALAATKKFRPKFPDDPFFKEFVVEYDGDTRRLIGGLKEAGFLPGIDLAPFGLENCLLIAVTEKRTKDEIDAYVRKAGELA